MFSRGKKIGMKKYTILVLLLLTSLKSLGQEKLIFAIDIVRHGDRNPNSLLTNSPAKLPKKDLGHLTLGGVEKAFDLGVSFRKKYINRYKLLPEIYKRDTKSQGPVIVFSTNYDRTFMTAEAIAQGLYPVEDRKKIFLPKTKTNIYSQIPFAAIDMPLADIKRYFKLVCDKHLFASSEWKKKNRQLEIEQSTKLKDWEGKLGIKLNGKVNKLLELSTIGDDIKVYRECGLPLPYNLSDDDAQYIIDINGWGYLKSCNVKESASFIAKPTLRKVMKYLRMVNEGDSSVKYILFVSHDLVIGSILTMLGNPQDELPPYLANINFLVFETSKGECILRIYYNDRLIHVLGCSKNNVDCYLNKFLGKFKPRFVS